MKCDGSGIQTFQHSVAMSKKVESQVHYDQIVTMNILLQAQRSSHVTDTSLGQSNGRTERGICERGQSLSRLLSLHPHRCVCMGSAASVPCHLSSANFEPFPQFLLSIFKIFIVTLWLYSNQMILVQIINEI